MPARRGPSEISAGVCKGCRERLIRHQTARLHQKTAHNNGLNRQCQGGQLGCTPTSATAASLYRLAKHHQQSAEEPRYDVVGVLLGGDGHCYQEEESTSRDVRHATRFAIFEALITLVIVSRWANMHPDATDGTKMLAYAVGLGLFSLFSWVNYVCNA